MAQEAKSGEVFIKGSDVRPVPDPTELTNRAMEKVSASFIRELDNLKLNIEHQSNGIVNVFNTRLSAMDEAIRLLQAKDDRKPTEAETLVSHTKELLEERIRALNELLNKEIASIQIQFVERDERSRLGAEASDKAINAAFKAQSELQNESTKSIKESISKSDSATEKRMESTLTLIDANNKGLAAAIEAQKDTTTASVRQLENRITALENRGIGAKEQVVTQQQSGNYLIAIAGVVLALIAIAVSVVIAIGGK